MIWHVMGPLSVKAPKNLKRRGNISKCNKFMEQKIKIKSIYFKVSHASGAECRASISFSLLSNEYLRRDTF